MRLGSAGKECLSPVAFDYLAGVYGYTGTAESAGLDKFDYVLISQASFVTADLNGDGRHALVNATMGKLKAVTYDGGSLVERLLYDADNTPLFSLTRMDFNGDGKDEILFLRMRKDPNSANADMQWMLYTANGVVALGDTWTAPPAGPNGIVYSLAGGSTGFATYAPLVADLDQNGSLDLFLPINGSWVAYLNRSGAIPPSLVVPCSAASRPSTMAGSPTGAVIPAAACVWPAARPASCLQVSGAVAAAWRRRRWSTLASSWRGR